MNVLKKLFRGKVAPEVDLDDSQPYDDVWYKIRDILPLVNPTLADSLRQAQLFGDYQGMQRLLQKGVASHQHVQGYNEALQNLSITLLMNPVRSFDRRYTYDDTLEHNEPARARRRARMAAMQAQQYGDSFHGGRKRKSTKRKRRTSRKRKSSRRH